MISGTVLRGYKGMGSNLLHSAKHVIRKTVFLPPTLPMQLRNEKDLDRVVVLEYIVSVSGQ